MFYVEIFGNSSGTNYKLDICIPIEMSLLFIMVSFTLWTMLLTVEQMSNTHPNYNAVINTPFKFCCNKILDEE